MINYDRNIIQTFANDLYNQADITIILTTLLYGSIGGVVGYYMFSTTGAVLLLLLAGFIGYLVGAQKAFLLKLQAQIALCQAQIEKNTAKITEDIENQATVDEVMQTEVEVKKPLPLPEGPQGLCPNCKTVIQLSANECPKCTAQFGIGSIWKIQPL